MQAAARTGQIGASDSLVTIVWYGLTYAPLHAYRMFAALDFYAERLDLDSREPLTCLDLGAGPGTTAGSLAGALEVADNTARRMQYWALDHNPHQLELATDVMHAVQPGWRVETHGGLPPRPSRLSVLLLVTTNHVWNQGSVSQDTIAARAALVAELLPEHGGHLLCIEPFQLSYGQLQAFLNALVRVGVTSGRPVDPDHPALRYAYRYRFGTSLVMRTADGGTGRQSR